MQQQHQQLKQGEINLGTTIMAVEFNGGVVIGADSRTTTGSYIANRVTDKLTFITENIYCCRSGSAADTQAVADMLKYYSEIYEQESSSSSAAAAASGGAAGAAVKVKLVANLFSSICYQNKDKLQAGIIVAGYDYHSQSGEVYSVPLGGSLHRQPFAIGGSGSTFIYGYCDAAYKEGMTREETVNFVKQCNPLEMYEYFNSFFVAVALAMSRDGSSGGVIRIAVITKDGVERMVFKGKEVPTHYEL